MATSNELKTLRREKKDVSETIKNLQHDIIVWKRRIEELKVQKKELFERIKELRAEGDGRAEAA